MVPFHQTKFQKKLSSRLQETDVPIYVCADGKNGPTDGQLIRADEQFIAFKTWHILL